MFQYVFRSWNPLFSISHRAPATRSTVRVDTAFLLHVVAIQRSTTSGCTRSFIPQKTRRCVVRITLTIRIGTRTCGQLSDQTRPTPPLAPDSPCCSTPPTSRLPGNVQTASWASFMDRTPLFLHPNYAVLPRIQRRMDNPLRFVSTQTDVLFHLASHVPFCIGCVDESIRMYFREVTRLNVYWHDDWLLYEDPTCHHGRNMGPTGWPKVDSCRPSWRATYTLQISRNTARTKRLMMTIGCFILSRSPPSNLVSCAPLGAARGCKPAAPGARGSLHLGVKRGTGLSERSVRAKEDKERGPLR